MDAVIFALVLVALAAYVARPLYAATGAGRSAGEAELAARRDALVAELRELEWDHASGLIEPDDYLARKATAEAETAEALRRLPHKPSPAE